ERPYFAIVEPEKADCFYRSGVAGRPTPAEGALDTIMAGLACGEVSPLAWRILATGADAFMTIDDEAAVDCMRLLAAGRFGDDPLVAGESGGAGGGGPPCGRGGRRGGGRGAPSPPRHGPGRLRPQSLRAECA